jgi:hypothetical protein
MRVSRTVFTGLFRTPRYAGWEREKAMTGQPLITCAFHNHTYPGVLNHCHPGPFNPIPPCPASALTKLGHVVDECVSLTISIQISQLGTAVQGQVVDAEPTLPCTAGIQQGTLGERRENSFRSLTTQPTHVFLSECHLAFSPHLLPPASSPAGGLRSLH